MAADAFEEAPADAVGIVDPMGGGTDLAMDDVQESPTAAAGAVGYEVPFTLLQCLTLLCIVLMLSLCGMLMSDLVRNMWAYSETAAPVSSLTDSLI
ncbi:MAG: DNA-binding protein, partial [Planctomycetota bacterium]